MILCEIIKEINSKMNNKYAEIIIYKIKKSWNYEIFNRYDESQWKNILLIDRNSIVMRIKDIENENSIKYSYNNQNTDRNIITLLSMLKNIEPNTIEPPKHTKEQLQKINNYNRNNYDTIIFRLPKGYKDQLKAQADKQNMSIAMYLKSLIDLNETEK